MRIVTSTFLCQSLCEENALEIYKTAKEVKDDELVRQATDFLEDNSVIIERKEFDSFVKGLDKKVVKKLKQLVMIEE